jgi:hypothetical protein
LGGVVLNAEAQVFLATGFLSGCPRLIDLASSALQFYEDSNTTTAAPIRFDPYFLRQYQLGARYDMEAFEATAWKNRKHDLQSAVRGGTAVFLVKTHVGGYSGNYTQLNHLVAIAVEGLERPIEPNTGSSHLILLDGTRSRGYRYEWDMAPHQRHEPSSAKTLQVFPRDNTSWTESSQSSTSPR